MTKQNFPVVDHYQVMRVTKGRVQVLLMPSSQRPPETHSGLTPHLNEADTQMKSHGVSQQRTYYRIQACAGWFERRSKGSRWRIQQSLTFPQECLVLLCLDNIHASDRCPTMVTDLQTGPVFLLIHRGHAVAPLGVVKLFTPGKQTP